MLAAYGIEKQISDTRPQRVRRETLPAPYLRWMARRLPGQQWRRVGIPLYLRMGGLVLLHVGTAFVTPTEGQ